MPIELQCPCGKRLRMNEEAAGKQGQCPVCGAILDIPSQEQTLPSFPVRELPAGEPYVTPSTAQALYGEAEAVTDEPVESFAGDGSRGKLNALEEVARPPYTLSSPGQIGLVGFIGGPLAGTLLMARNYAKLGRGAACWGTVLAGFAVVAALVFGGDLLFSEATYPLRFLLAIPVWIGVYLAARRLQGPAFEAHRARGGGETSGGVVLGFVVLGLALTLGPLLLLEASLADHRLRVNPGEEVLYSKGVTEAEAQTLGQVLKQQGVFNGRGEKTVRFTKVDGEYVLGIVLIFGFDGPYEEFLDLAGHVSRALGGKPVRVELLDQMMNTKKKLNAVRNP